MSRYIDFDYSTKGLAINLPNGTIKSDQEGCLICDLIVGADISNNSITLDKLDESILNLLMNYLSKNFRLSLIKNSNNNCYKIIKEEFERIYSTNDNSIKIWNTKSGELLKTFDVNN